MKKCIAIGSAFTVALGLAACTPPAESDGEAAPEETVEMVEEVSPDADGAMDDAMEGAMADEASATEGEADDTSGPDADGNPIQN